MRRLRHLLCGVMAQCLIRTDRARRAAERALSGEVVTAIYFHKPNKKLFASCIHWLIRNGYTLLSIEDLIDIMENKRTIPRGAAWISLDDGYREWMDDVLPLVQELRIPVTFFIPSGIVAGEGLFPWMLKTRSGANGKPANGHAEPKPSRMAMTLDDLKEAAKCPEVRIEAHGVNHRLTTNCSEAELRFEIGACKQDLEHWLENPVSCFSYPEGRYDGRERHALRESGYRMAVTTEPRFVEEGDDPMLVPRLCVPDDVTFAEAVCNMVGIWRPFLDPIKAALRIGLAAKGSPKRSAKESRVSAHS